MSNIRLLERLAQLEGHPQLRDSLPDRLLRVSIAHHLEHLLNTRAGSVPIDPGYGISDMSNIAGSFALGTVESLSEAILRQVARYEPRLQGARMSVEKEERDVITLRFELQGRLASEREGAPDQSYAMTVRVNSAGRVYVEPKT